MYRPIMIDEEVCTGCNICVDICPSDVYEANPEKGKPPVVKYPEECWFDGYCVYRCPASAAGAIKIITPLPMRVCIKRG